MNIFFLLFAIKHFVILIFFTFQFVVSKELVEKDCLNAGDYFWKHMASKTPYRYVANRNDSELIFDGCRPKKLWTVIRHGTRYPGVKFINKMKTRLVKIQQSIKTNFEKKKSMLCPQSIVNISNWIPNMDVSNGKTLSHEGEDEMIELAERFQNRFPTLLEHNYSNSSLAFRCTATQRTIQSQYYFLVGLFGRKIANHVWLPEPIYKDPILRFYKICPKWLEEVSKSIKATYEVENFKTLNSTREILYNVSLRLGFDESLSFEDLETMYTTCSFESATNRREPSSWCYVFTKKEMEIMEYMRDLKHYWRDGYGFDINFKQACPLMKNMIDFLRSEEGPKASVYFTHSGTILKLLSHLGLYYDDKKLTAEDFARPRLWKLSLIDTFASNLAFVSYQCGDDLKLLSLHQERVLRLPGCPKTELCSFRRILKTFKESLTNCNFKEICEY